MTARLPEPCPFRHDDAAFVLGALSAPEREAYAGHLAGCPVCRRAVAELEGLPALLAKVPIDTALALDKAGSADDHGNPLTPGPPPGLVDGVLLRARRANRHTRRFKALVGAGAAAAAAAVAALAFLLWPAGDPTAPPAPTPASQSVELAALRGGPMQVAADLTQVAWGTRIKLTCTYAGADDAGTYEPSASYALVVRDRLGNDQQVATWGAVPGRQVTVQAATAVRLDSIASLEVRGPDGTPLLRANR